MKNVFLLNIVFLFFGLEFSSSGGSPMGLLISAIFGGLVGTILMDITAIAAEKLNITSGGRCGGPQVIGRWVFGIFDARFVHKDIIDSSPVKNEASVGWIFHYVTGGGLALTYPLFYLTLNRPMPQDHLIPSVVWGLATTILPWLILYPGYGWGLFGLRAPMNASPLIATPVAHMLYGLGLGIVLNIAT